MIRSIVISDKGSTNFVLIDPRSISVLNLWITGWNIHIFLKLVKRNFQEELFILDPFDAPKPLPKITFLAPQALPLFPSNHYSEVIFALQNITLYSTLAKGFETLATPAAEIPTILLT
jgi:hypothetical protein